MNAPAEPKVSVPETCVSCGASRPARFCSACGEKRLEPRDLSWREIFGAALQEFVHLDGRIFRTLRTLIAAPGRLTADYLRGKRKPYLAPLPLFLLCNLLFFLLQPLLNWNSLSTPLRLHIGEQPYSRWVRPLVEKKIAEAGMTLENYAARFDAFVDIEARALTLALVPLFLLPAALVSRRRRQAVAHVIFALHFCSWFLLCQLAVLSVAFLAIIALGDAYYQSHWVQFDQALRAVNFAIQTGYLYFAVRAVYGDGGVVALVKAAALAASMMIVVWAYRLFLFFVAFWRT